MWQAYAHALVVTASQIRYAAHSTRPIHLVPLPPQELMAKEIRARGGVILTGQPVRHIAQDGYGVAVYTDQSVVTAKYSVVAMPPHLSGRITYDPPLPPRRAQLTQRFPMGTTVKCIGLFKTPVSRRIGVRLVFRLCHGQRAGEEGLNNPSCSHHSFPCSSGASATAAPCPAMVWLLWPSSPAAL